MVKTIRWFAVFGCLIGCAEPPEPVPLTTVALAEVKLISNVSEKRYSGSVEPNARVSPAFRVGGFVQEIPLIRRSNGSSTPLQPGDRVARGQVLATLRQDEYVTQVNLAKAKLREAESGLAQSRSALKQAMVALEKSQLDWQGTQSF